MIRATRQIPSSSHVDRVRRAFALFLAVLPLGGFGGIESWLAPAKRLWPYWTKHDESSTQSLDHSIWHRLLATYVQRGEISLFRYADVNKADRRELKSYLRNMSQVTVSTYNRAEQLAFWINLYNAMTIDLVLDRYPVRSIRDIDISPGLLSFGPWDKKLVRIGSEELSLNDIEHRILRPIWQNPNIHYALNCASLGCPRLVPEAYTASNANALMEQGAFDFINGHGVRFDGRKLIVSSIYAWFTEDFGGTEAGVLNHLRRYAQPQLHDRLDGIQSIDGDAYDWRLNDAR